MFEAPEESGEPGARWNPRRGGRDGEDTGATGQEVGGDVGPAERWSRAAARVLPGSLAAPARRARLQRQQQQQEVSEPSDGGGGSLSAPLKLPGEAADKGSLTPAMRKRYLKELLLNKSFGSGFGSILQGSGCADGPEESGSGGPGGSCWALDPTEHAWMLSAVDGNYETLAEFLSADWSLLSKKDFVSGFTVLHWLAKYGRDETLVKLLRLAESRGSPVDVNLKGSGGLTPLHVAAMHGQHMVLKILVGAFGADVDAMDHGGRRAWQYLRGGRGLEEMKELLGASQCLAEARNANNNNCSSSSSSCSSRPIGAGEHVDPPPRPPDRGAFGAFRRLLAPLLSLGNLGSRSSVRARS